MFQKLNCRPYVPEIKDKKVTLKRPRNKIRIKKETKINLGKEGWTSRRRCCTM